MAHICGYCSNCCEILFHQGGVPGAVAVASMPPPALEVRGIIASGSNCCNCGLVAPQLWGSHPADRIVKNHGQHPQYVGHRRS